MEIMAMQTFIEHETFIIIQKKRFHYVWLRDNCLCHQCYDPSARQKIGNLVNFETDPRPYSVNLQNDALVIDWDNKSEHQSVFPIPWLLQNTYDPKPKVDDSNHQILWDQMWFDTHEIEWPDYCLLDHQRARQLLTGHLSSLGVAVLRNLTLENLEALLLSIGPIYEFAKFGNFSTVKPVSSSSTLSSDLSMSSEGHSLSPHTDFSYLNAPPLVQALFCVENDAHGGESTLVDGFRLAADFAREYPAHFHTLASTPVIFNQYIERWNYFFSRSSPIFRLDSQGQLSSICFSHKNINISLEYDKTEEFYQAYHRFLHYLNNPYYQYCYRLKKGDCLFVYNARVLHGRNAFDAGSGARHLEIVFTEWDYFQGIKNFDWLLNS